MINDDFINEYTLDGVTGFDFALTTQYIKDAKEKYPDIIWCLGSMAYPEEMRAEIAYTHAVTNFEEHGITLEEGDIIFPSEADVFYHENDRDKIDKLINEMKVGDAISSIWLDFVATQNYVEQKQHPDINPTAKHRRFAICYKDMDHYKSVVQNFISQDYSKSTRIIEDLFAYHYAWFRKGKYLNLRFKILNRPDGYWEDYNDGMRQAIEETKNKTFKEAIMVRPRSQGNYRFIRYIDIDHPIAIHKHPCYIK